MRINAVSVGGKHHRDHGRDKRIVNRASIGTGADYHVLWRSGQPRGIKQQKKNPTGNLSGGGMAPQVGLEPTTLRLTAECSAIELLRNMDGVETCSFYPYGIRRRPTLPGRFQPSTIGAKRLNFCVRDGNRWDPLAIITGK